jgi:hypothetical protein
MPIPRLTLSFSSSQRCERMLRLFANAEAAAQGEVSEAGLTRARGPGEAHAGKQSGGRRKQTASRESMEDEDTEDAVSAPPAPEAVYRNRRHVQNADGPAARTRRQSQSVL